MWNSGKEPVRVRARITDWDLARDGTPQFEGVPEGGPSSASGWIWIAPPELLIDPGKESIVRFNLTVPQEVEPAGYRTGILFEFLPPSSYPATKGREVQFRSRIASLIYVNVGAPPINVELTDLRHAHDQGEAARRRGPQEHEQADGPHQGLDDAVRPRRCRGLAGAGARRAAASRARARGRHAGHDDGKDPWPTASIASKCASTSACRP